MPLVRQPVDLGLERDNVLVRLLLGCLAGWILVPALVVRVGFLQTALLAFDLLAELAVLGDVLGVVDQFHAAGFAHAIFALAVLTKVAPFPVVAAVAVLLVIAHCGSDGR